MTQESLRRAAHPPSGSFTRRRRVAALVAALGFVAVNMPAADAADYLRPYRGHAHHRHGRLAAYRDDRACPDQEPVDYKPRIENFREPKCYAARPYGLSMHLYDYAQNLDERADYEEDGNFLRQFGVRGP